MTQTALCRICIGLECFVQAKSRGWKFSQVRAKSVLTGCVAQAAAGSCRNCPKRPAKAALKNSREHGLTLTRSEENRSVQGMRVGINNAVITPVAESTSQFQNDKKFMSNQTIVTTPAPQTTPTLKPATSPPAAVNAPQRPAADTGATPKLLAPAASAAPTSPPAATQAQKPQQQQTVPPASGKVRKPRSGRSH